MRPNLTSTPPISSRRNDHDAMWVVGGSVSRPRELGIGSGSIVPCGQDRLGSRPDRWGCYCFLALEGCSSTPVRVAELVDALA